MAKNYATVYDYGASIALEQRFYIKAETTRGQLIAPTGADFFFTNPGASVNMTQGLRSSPIRTGRHHTSTIKDKKVTSWSIPTFFMIDTTLGSAGVAEIDPALRLLWKSLLGGEDVSSGLKFTPTVPNVTFSIHEVLDRLSKQTRGGFVQQTTVNFPGTGDSTLEWTGDAKDIIYVGLGKSVTDNSGGNTITLVSGDGGQFIKSAGGMVMVIKSNGTTRSTDTPDGTPRKITGVVGDVVTVDGAALADADGSGVGTPIYLVYYEPATPTAINNPQTGLEATLTVTGLASPICLRNGTLTLSNNSEKEDYCWGTDSLDGQIFIPGDKFTAAVSVEANIDRQMFNFFQKILNFESQAMLFKLGPYATSRYFEQSLPAVKFMTPEIPVPDTGSIPVTFQGTGYQTALDAGDEYYAWYK